jgi:hypothetical protein
MGVILGSDENIPRKEVTSIEKNCLELNLHDDLLDSMDIEVGRWSYR